MALMTAQSSFSSHPRHHLSSNRLLNPIWWSRRFGSPFTQAWRQKSVWLKKISLPARWVKVKIMTLSWLIVWNLDLARRAVWQAKSTHTLIFTTRSPLPRSLDWQLSLKCCGVYLPSHQRKEKRDQVQLHWENTPIKDFSERNQMVNRAVEYHSMEAM